MKDDLKFIFIALAVLIVIGGGIRLTKKNISDKTEALKIETKTGLIIYRFPDCYDSIFKNAFADYDRTWDLGGEYYIHEIKEGDVKTTKTDIDTIKCFYYMTGYGNDVLWVLEPKSDTTGGVK